MDRQKMIQQAKILRDKKLARMAQLGKQLQPQVEAGVVKYAVPVVEKNKDVRQFSAPPLLVRSARTVVPNSQQTQQQQDMRPQNVNSNKVVRKSSGCSGCSRKPR